VRQRPFSRSSASTARFARWERAEASTGTAQKTKKREGETSAGEEKVTKRMMRMRMTRRQLA